MSAEDSKIDNEMNQLSKFSILVADSGEIEQIRKYTPTDATTNPSLLFKAAQMEEYQSFVDDAISFALSYPDLPLQEQIKLAIDRLFVNFGKEISNIVPGFVSTEVDAHLSFDVNGTIERARRIIKMYEDLGVSRSRILIKIATTWEGIEAARQLEKEGITCNMTLVFSLVQAIACAEAGATLISPFVGRILDWHKKNSGRTSYPAHEDPGVISVTGIYNYFKKFGHSTIVMGASFRNVDEILALSGCDRLTISPALLEELRNRNGLVERFLSPESAAVSDIQKIEMNEKVFRLMLNDDPMATEKLAEGIRSFSADLKKLEAIIEHKIQQRIQISSFDGLNQLEQLSRITAVVADTGDFESIKKFRPIDATTNPSLLLKAANMPQYEHLVLNAIEFGKQFGNISDNERLNLIVDKMAVNFGCEILKIVPGYVSTEVDARLSFDTEATLNRARRIIDLYQQAGIDRKRILIKIATTWEGIEAARQLEKEGITCNMTLVFNLVQAAACAEAGATLISPFVGRILDWHKKNSGRTSYPGHEDPGVISVAGIYNYFKKFGYSTIVMGASFRNVDEILELAGCDRLTISPALLEELQSRNDLIQRKLHPENASKLSESVIGHRLVITEESFRRTFNDDAMATEKLAEGIRLFSKDIALLEEIITKRLH